VEKKTAKLNFPEKIILASASPRRAQLLKSIGVNFEIHDPSIKEDWPSDIQTERVAEYLARQKSEAMVKHFPNHFLITADTIVVFAGKILGKPKDKDEAFKMLTMLSGKFHDVITGVCLQQGGKIESFSDRSRVQFKDLSKEEIVYYIDNFAPYDKAGAYGIQEWIGMIGVHYLEGSYFNIMGLPIHRLYEALVNWK